MQINTGVIDVQKMNVQVEVLGCNGAKTKYVYGDEVVGWAIYRWAMYRCNDL
jgi:hypothetical protein